MAKRLASSLLGRGGPWGGGGAGERGERWGEIRGLGGRWQVAK